MSSGGGGVRALACCAASCADAASCVVSHAAHLAARLASASLVDVRASVGPVLL